jgi:hypothetical protein
MAAMPGSTREAWQNLLTHATETRSTKPSAKWRKGARSFLASVGEEEFRRHMLAWVPLVNQDRQQPMSDLKAEMLKGLVWFCGSYDDDEIKRLLVDVALACYHKVPGIGARAMKVGNACVHVLGELGSIAELVQLRLRIKYRTVRNGGNNGPDLWTDRCRSVGANIGRLHGRIAGRRRGHFSNLANA